jgi:DNA-binding PadR family transcriptional regulator
VGRARQDNPKALLPLTHLTYHIMLALGEGRSHGYAIVKSVRDRSHGAISPGTGTFYSALRRMLDEGVLVEVDQPPGFDGSDSRRRFYELSPFGRQVLSAETTRLRELVEWAESAVS